jgi:hypothetical protein
MNMKTDNSNVLVGDIVRTEPLSRADREFLDEAARNVTAARVPFSGGADRVWSTIRGADTAGRALSRAWAALRH